ncbi:hypothetical protein [Pleionea sediminis]|uniref:hypothetical protein n=1 Tax=Pleionea sediminis TaxID=2569479 RepID=UPI0011851BC7|nr:hypothetical protein [Pleionea sediminis]
MSEVKAPKKKSGVRQPSDVKSVDNERKVDGDLARSLSDNDEQPSHQREQAKDESDAEYSDAKHEASESMDIADAESIEQKASKPNRRKRRVKKQVDQHDDFGLYSYHPCDKKKVAEEELEEPDHQIDVKV